MNYQPTQNLQASVSGKIRIFEPALVALLNVNDVCTLMMHVMILLYDFMLNLQLVMFKKYIHHQSQNPQYALA